MDAGPARQVLHQGGGLQRRLALHGEVACVRGCRARALRGGALAVRGGRVSMQWSWHSWGNGGQNQSTDKLPSKSGFGVGGEICKA